MNLENQLAKTNPSVLLKIPRAQISVNIKVINQSLRYHDGYVMKNSSDKVNGRSFNLRRHYSNFFDIQVLRHLFKFSIKLQIRQFHIVMVE